MPEDARMGITLNSLQGRNASDRLAGASTAAQNNRIHTDINRVKDTTERIRNATNIIVQYAHTLGYFEPPKEINPTVEPIITTMSDAIIDLERASNDLVGSLNLFN